MLHIILGILKLIGVLFGALLLLILLLTTILLLIPIRYQVRLVKTEAEMNGQVRLTWLLHLISARFYYDVNRQEKQIAVRIFGVSLDKLKSIWSKRKEKRLKRQRAKLQKEPETEIKKEVQKETKEETKENQESRLPLGTVNIMPDEAAVQESEAEENIINRLICLLGSAVKLIKGIAAGTVNLYEKLRMIPEQIDSALKMLEEYEVKVAAKDVKRELDYIWKHYGLRRAEGYLRFGTGDPALTGQLTGVLYMLLPVKTEKMELQPEFSEQKLEMKLTAKGHVRSCHAIPVIWRLLRNKRVVRLLKKLKNHANRTK